MPHETAIRSVGPKARAARASIRASLSAVLALFALLIAILAAFSIIELRAVNQISAEIRDRWLQSTRTLGDLNNYTSDARAAEASRLLARDEAERTAVDGQVRDLDRLIASAESHYRRIPHDPDETALFARFDAAWRQYRAQSEAVLAASRAGQAQAAAGLYMSQSLTTYGRASDQLGVLTDRTVAGAARASNEAAATYRRARALIIAAVALTAIGLISAVRYIIQGVSDPLLDLAGRMRALAANETQTDVIGVDRRDEIGEMARAVLVFRANAIELAHSQRGLVQQAAMLEERLEAERRLTTLQRNFVSMASHEFRTPLTIIDGHAQRLTALSQQMTPADIELRAARIRRAVLRLRHVIDNLLKSSRVWSDDSGLYFHPKPIDLETLLLEVCQTHEEISSGARIETRIEGLAGDFIGDADLLQQAISNLLSNAIKYSPPRAHVLLSAWGEADKICIRVEDQGLGVPEADLPFVFDRFYRGANVTDIVGTGVGLFLVRLVAGLHGGEVAVRSQEGAGSHFELTLPHRPPRPDPPPPA